MSNKPIKPRGARKKDKALGSIYHDDKIPDDRQEERKKVRARAKLLEIFGKDLDGNKTS